MRKQNSNVAMLAGRSFPTFVYGKVVEHMGKYRETGDADWLIHAARACMRADGNVLKRLVRTGVIASERLDTSTLDWNHNPAIRSTMVPPCITVKNAAALGVKLAATHWLHGHTPEHEDEQEIIRSTVLVTSSGNPHRSGG